MSETVRVAIARYLEEVDEHVVRPRYEKTARVLSIFLEWLSEQNIADFSKLSEEHGCVFMERLIARFGEGSRDIAEAETVMKRFAKWVKRKEQAPALYAWFYKQ